MLSLTQILAASAGKSGGYVASAGEDWSQGRTLYGGLIAALANEAMRRKVSADRPLRGLQIVYVGPNAPGEVSLSPEVVREGKAVTLAGCTVRSDGAVSATVSAMYGAARSSMLDIKPVAQNLTVMPEQAPDVPTRPGFLPNFTLHYQQRWARGQYPFTRASDSNMSVYVRYRDEGNRSLTESHALALMDAIPSPALALMEKPSPASTLSWTLEFLDHRFDFRGDEWWRLDAVVDAAADGYVVHSSQVINPAGAVAAISRQVVVVYG
jgi:acyl-CoA thioesterase